MENNTKRIINNILWTFVIVTVFCLLGKGIYKAAANNEPSKADYKNLEDIKANQKAKAQLEEWNAAEVAELNRNGWNVQWSSDPDSLVLVPLL